MQVLTFPVSEREGESMVSARSICFVDSFDGFVHFELWFVEKRLVQLYSYVLDEERHGKML